jgi:hypothetical protein
MVGGGAASPGDGMLECARHGTRQATFVCGHLAATLAEPSQVGFFTSDDPDNPRPDAWCAACEARVQRTGAEWTENAAPHGEKLLYLNGVEQNHQVCP